MRMKFNVHFIAAGGTDGICLSWDSLSQAWVELPHGLLIPPRIDSESKQWTLGETQLQTRTSERKNEKTMAA